MQQLTKKHKAEISACEYCGSQNNLESAHIHGRERNVLIDLILSEYMSSGIAEVEIDQFEERFKKEHQPLEKSILILCRNCHRQYDSKAAPAVSPSQRLAEPTDKFTSIDNKVGYLPITLEPANPDKFKEELLNTRQATIETYFSDGSIEQNSWNAFRFSETSNVFRNLRSRPEFRSGNWQEKGIVKVHVKVSKNA